VCVCVRAHMRELCVCKSWFFVCVKAGLQ